MAVMSAEAENTIWAPVFTSGWCGMVSSFIFRTVFDFIISTSPSLPVLLLSFMKWRQLLCWVRVVSISSLWTARSFSLPCVILSICPISEDFSGLAEGDAHSVTFLQYNDYQTFCVSAIQEVTPHHLCCNERLN